MCTHLFFLQREEGLNLQPNLKKEGLTGPQLLEGVAGKEGSDFFQERVQLSHKLKSEIFNGKKSL